MSTSKKVNIAEFKARMGVYLKRVRGGEEVILKDRNMEIAKISPIIKEGLPALKIQKARRTSQDFDDFITTATGLHGIDSLKLLSETREDKK